jgi:hypothetical protein
MTTTQAFYKTFSDLKDALLVYCEDDTAEYQAVLPDIIARAQDRVVADLNLELFVSFAAFTITTAVDTYTRPAGAKLDSIFYTDGGALTRMSAEFCKSYPITPTGRPKWFGELSSTEIILRPMPDAGYSASAKVMTRPAVLSDSAPTNWVSENSADLLFWACLIESEAFLLAPERINEFKALYAQMLLARGNELRELQRVEYVGGKGVVSEQTAQA